jgi:transcriptional regulator with GAF, ATPase, and Fis domain
VDVRLIAATNRNLRVEVKRQNFREDLYFRIAAAHVHVPPLRERIADLPLLVAHFLEACNPPRTLADLPAHVLRTFETYEWPGNVRELQHAVQRLLVTPERALDALAVAPPVDVESATRIKPELPPLRVARGIAADDFERSYLAALLDKTSGNVTRAAAIAQVSRQMIQKLRRKHGL